MILPVRRVTRTLHKMKLPIYHTKEGNKCHFKDVCIKLTLKALKDQGFMDDQDYAEDDMLLSEWHANHRNLNEKDMLEEHSGSFWAGLYIARLFKNMQRRISNPDKKE